MPPKSFAWFGLSVAKGLSLTGGLKGKKIFVDNGEFSQVITVSAGKMPYMNLQPPRPPGSSFELSPENKFPIEDE